MRPAAIQGLIEPPINERPNCGTHKSEQRSDDDLAKGTTATVVRAARDKYDRSEDDSETNDRPINRESTRVTVATPVSAKLHWWYCRRIRNRGVSMVSSNEDVVTVTTFPRVRLPLESVTTTSFPGWSNERSSSNDVAGACARLLAGNRMNTVAHAVTHHRQRFIGNIPFRGRI